MKVRREYIQIEICRIFNSGFESFFKIIFLQHQWLKSLNSTKPTCCWNFFGESICGVAGGIGELGFTANPIDGEGTDEIGVVEEESDKQS